MFQPPGSQCCLTGLHEFKITASPLSTSLPSSLSMTLCKAYSIIRRPHKGRCSEPRRAPKCNQGRPLCALGKAGLVQKPIGHDHVISGRLGRMRMCMSAYACPQALWFAGLPVPVPRATALRGSRKQNFQLQETRSPITRNKKSWSGVWLRRGLLYTHTQWWYSFSA